AEPPYQTCSASYGWLREAARLNHFLMKNAWKQIADPILLSQAENDTIVSKDQQKKFVRKLAGAEQMRNSSNMVRFLCISGAKHEIFRSDDATFAKFITRCLEFYP
ncbi:MAG: alpha/beta hydrolase, partial [Clostridiales bacterium]|nr:alpha/beta hydrolase [Clostridiales bacterium]